MSATITTLEGKLSPMGRDEYDADTTRMRATALKDLVVPEQGPRCYYLKHIAKAFFEDEKTPSHLVLGILFHEWILEGRQSWCVATMRRDERSKEYREFKEANAGKVCITAEDEKKLCGWREGLLRNRQARAIVEMPRHEEQVGLWNEQVEFVDVEGEVLTRIVPGKMAIDLWPFAVPKGFDSPARFCIKTDAAFSGWEHTVFRNGYHVQAAWYERGVHAIPEWKDTPRAFAHIVVEKKAPFWCYVRPLSDSALNLGNKDCELALERYCWGKRAEELGYDPLDAWPDLVENDQSAPVMPPVWVNEEFGKRHSSPLTSNEPAWEETNGNAVPDTYADFIRHARNAG